MKSSNSTASEIITAADKKPVQHRRERNRGRARVKKEEWEGVRVYNARGLRARVRNVIHTPLTFRGVAFVILLFFSTQIPPLCRVGSIIFKLRGKGMERAHVARPSFSPVSLSENTMRELESSVRPCFNISDDREDPLDFLRRMNTCVVMFDIFFNSQNKSISL